MCTVGKAPKTPVRRAEGLSPTVHALLATRPPDGLRMKPQYQHLRCKDCRRFASEEVFKVGFDDEAIIRIKGDFGFTNDRVFLISDKFRNALKAGNVKGFDSKPIGKTGWHAFLVTKLVDARMSVITTTNTYCTTCGVPQESGGLHQRMSDFSLPEETNTFFSTKKGWPSAFCYDRETFLTEDVFDLLMRSGIRGGYATRLWTEEESQKFSEMQKRGRDIRPLPGTSFCLNGKLPKIKSKGEDMPPSSREKLG